MSAAATAKPSVSELFPSPRTQWKASKRPGVPYSDWSVWLHSCFDVSYALVAPRVVAIGERSGGEHRCVVGEIANRTREGMPCRRSSEIEV